MIEPIRPEFVAALARLAGFEFPLDRCARLAPQVEWLRSEARSVDVPGLAALEPVTIFRPAVSPGPASGGRDG